MPGEFYADKYGNPLSVMGQRLEDSAMSDKKREALETIAKFAAIVDCEPNDRLSGEEVMYGEGVNVGLRQAGAIAVAALSQPPAPGGREEIALHFTEASIAPDVKRGRYGDFIIVTENDKGGKHAFAAYYLNGFPLEHDECICGKAEDHDGGCPTTGWFYDNSNFEYENCYFPISGKVLRWAPIPEADAILALGPALSPQDRSTGLGDLPRYPSNEAREYASEAITAMEGEVYGADKTYAVAQHIQAFADSRPTPPAPGADRAAEKALRDELMLLRMIVTDVRIMDNAGHFKEYDGEPWLKRVRNIDLHHDPVATAYTVSRAEGGAK